MKLKILWPGRTRNSDMKMIQDDLLKKIGRLNRCELIETKEARGLGEKQKNKIMDVEAQGLEKYFGNDYIICLSDKGKEMSSNEFARFLGKMTSHSKRAATFVVGGFLGLDKRIIQRADLLLSLSKMTFSHELIRLILLEQIYRSLTILKGHHYAK